MATVLSEGLAARLQPTAPTRKRIGPVAVDPARDTRLTDFGKATLRDRYLLPGESFQDLFARVGRAYADDTAHAERLYDYMARTLLKANLENGADLLKEVSSLLRELKLGWDGIAAPSKV